MVRDPAGGRLQTHGRVRVHGDGDDLRRLYRIRFLVLIDLEVMAAVAVVIELVWQNEFVVVAIAVEGADWIRVGGPSFVAGNVPLQRPGLATVEGLIEAQQMV